MRAHRVRIASSLGTPVAAISVRLKTFRCARTVRGHKDSPELRQQIQSLFKDGTPPA